MECLITVFAPTPTISSFAEPGNHHNTTGGNVLASEWDAEGYSNKQYMFLKSIADLGHDSGLNIHSNAFNVDPVFPGGCVKSPGGVLKLRLI